MAVFSKSPPGIPSESKGMARSQYQSANPGLWRDLVCYLSPSVAHPGGLLRDLSGSNNDGTIVDATYTPTDGPRGGSGIQHAGSPEYYKVDDSPALKFGTDPFTVGIWVKTSTTNVSQILNKGVSGQGHGADANSFAISIDNGNLVRFSCGTDGSAIIFNVSSFFDDQWHFVCGTLIPEEGPRLYIDGVLVVFDSSYTISSITRSQDMIIGADWDLAGLNFLGSTSELMIWRRALSGDEVRTLWQDPFAIIRLRRRVLRPFGGIGPIAGGDRLVSYPSGDPLFSDPSGDPLKSFRVDAVIAMGALIGSSALLSGLAKLKSSRSGDGVLVASAASLSGFAVRTGAVTGTLVSSSPTLTNSVITKGTGILSTLQSTLSGQGRKVAKASGTLVAISEISGTPIKLSPSQGALLALSPRLAGFISLNRLRVGAGVLEAQSLLEGFAQKVEPTGGVADGVLVASSSLLSGVGKKFELKIGDGILSTSAPTLSARAKKVATGEGAINTSSSVLSGRAILVGKSSGDLVASAGVLSGSGIKRAAVSGSLLASALLSGDVDQIKPIGTEGSLVASSPAIQSLCLKLGNAGGQLQSQATLNGSARKISTGAVGNLVASSSAIYGGARNESTADEQAYRIRSIMHIPGNPTTRVLLEPIRRPLS